MTDPDEDLVRRAIRAIGDEAARPEPIPTPAPEPIPAPEAIPTPAPEFVPAPVRDTGTAGPWWRTRRTAVAVSVAAAACVVAVTATLLTSSGGGRPAPQDGQGQTLPQWISCATTIAVGDVATVRPTPSKAGHITVTFHVTEWIKPGKGERQVTLDVVDPAKADEEKKVEPGQHALIVVPRRYDEELDIFRGAELNAYRARVTSHLAEAAHTPCPAFWSRTRP
ncbi:hypothetical protein [Streptomyces sp. NPDC026659]|uniref:hypothetical protein n=1 Tax=Streptomyces sp. NPDC026659 TaxID=3155123 RepID=UPI0033F10994